MVLCAGCVMVLAVLTRWSGAECRLCDGVSSTQQVAWCCVQAVCERSDRI